jgi:hypothetical protein
MITRRRRMNPTFPTLQFDSDAMCGALQAMMMRILRAGKWAELSGKLNIVLDCEQTDALIRRALFDPTLYHLIERIAVVIGQTYADLGEGAMLADDHALEMIRDLLLDYQPEIIERNRGRHLPGGGAN